MEDTSFVKSKRVEECVGGWQIFPLSDLSEEELLSHQLSVRVSPPAAKQIKSTNSSHSPHRGTLYMSDSSRLHQAGNSLILWIKQFLSSPGDRENEACTAKEDSSVRELLHSLLEFHVRRSIQPFPPALFKLADKDPCCWLPGIWLK